MADHPKHGRIRVDNALDLPLNRVRAWLDGGIPDSVRGIQVAIDHGWLDADPDSETATGFVELLTHVLAGGNIAVDAFVPAVTTAQRVELDEIREAFDRVDVESLVRHGDTDECATEIIPE